ncbi:hypothetical protein Q8F55_006741 [Vanrija albida]|uniref:Uncharacterized protein n=1 Tax=Vanrija albida TaxID=181172 RepID=A0ABR3PXZ0_9TREE
MTSAVVDSRTGPHHSSDLPQLKIPDELPPLEASSSADSAKSSASSPGASPIKPCLRSSQSSPTLSTTSSSLLAPPTPILRKQGSAVRISSPLRQQVDGAEDESKGKKAVSNESGNASATASPQSSGKSVTSSPTASDTSREKKGRTGLRVGWAQTVHDNSSSESSFVQRKSGRSTSMYETKPDENSAAESSTNPLRGHTRRLSNSLSQKSLNGNRPMSDGGNGRGLWGDMPPPPMPMPAPRRGLWGDVPQQAAPSRQSMYTSMPGLGGAAPPGSDLDPNAPKFSRARLGRSGVIMPTAAKNRPATVVGTVNMDSAPVAPAPVRPALRPTPSVSSSGSSGQSSRTVSSTPSTARSSTPTASAPASKPNKVKEKMSFITRSLSKRVASSNSAPKESADVLAGARSKGESAKASVQGFARNISNGRSLRHPRSSPQLRTTTPLPPTEPVPPVPTLPTATAAAIRHSQLPPRKSSKDPAQADPIPRPPSVPIPDTPTTTVTTPFEIQTPPELELSLPDIDLSEMILLPDLPTPNNPVFESAPLSAPVTTPPNVPLPELPTPTKASSGVAPLPTLRIETAPPPSSDPYSSAPFTPKSPPRSEFLAWSPRNSPPPTARPLPQSLPPGAAAALPIVVPPVHPPPKVDVVLTAPPAILRPPPSIASVASSVVVPRANPSTTPRPPTFVSQKDMPPAPVAPAVDEPKKMKSMDKLRRKDKGGVSLAPPPSMMFVDQPALPTPPSTYASSIYSDVSSSCNGPPAFATPPLSPMMFGRPSSALQPEEPVTPPVVQKLSTSAPSTPSLSSTRLAPARTGSSSLAIPPPVPEIGAMPVPRLTMPVPTIGKTGRPISRVSRAFSDSPTETSAEYMESVSACSIGEPVTATVAPSESCESMSRSTTPVSSIARSPSPFAPPRPPRSPHRPPTPIADSEMLMADDDIPEVPKTPIAPPPRGASLTSSARPPMRAPVSRHHHKFRSPSILSMDSDASIGSTHSTQSIASLTSASSAASIDMPDPIAEDEQDEVVYERGSQDSNTSTASAAIDDKTSSPPPVALVRRVTKASRAMAVTVRT